MSGVDLGDLERRHTARQWHPPVWAQLLGLVAVVGYAVSTAVRGGPWWLLVVWVVVSLSLGGSLIASRRGGVQVTCVEEGRVGTGTTTWRGSLDLTWWPWEQVERVEVPGRWDDQGVRLVLREGGERALPGVSGEDGRRLADALAASRSGSAEDV